MGGHKTPIPMRKGALCFVENSSRIILTMPLSRPNQGNPIEKRRSSLDPLCREAIFSVGMFKPTLFKVVPRFIDGRLMPGMREGQFKSNLDSLLNQGEYKGLGAPKKYFDCNGHDCSPG